MRPRRARRFGVECDSASAPDRAMKIIVGVFTAKPGCRDAYLAAAQDHITQSRLEPQCLYFNLVPIPDHPDKMLLAEAFTSEEAHRRHEDTDHMRAL